MIARISRPRHHSRPHPDNKKECYRLLHHGPLENSRNRVFTETEDGIRTEDSDQSKMVDPSLIIYHPVRL